MSRDFEIVQSRRKSPTVYQGDVIDSPCLSSQNNSRIGGVIADNFPKILDIVSEIGEIVKIKEKSDAVRVQMEEARKNLLAEAEAYAKKKKADTDSVIEQIQKISDIISGISNGKANLSGEVISQVISLISKVIEMGRL